MNNEYYKDEDFSLTRFCIFILLVINTILVFNILVTLKNINNNISNTVSNNDVKELQLSVSGSIIIDPIPSISSCSVGENTIGMGERSIYADLIDELNEEEKIMICQITFREAGNQPIEGKRAVIEVILNRVNSEYWPDTVEDVLSQNRQFATQKGRNSVSQDNVYNIMEILEERVYVEEPILPSIDYVYFNSLDEPGINNPIKIEGHWFGTR